MSAGEGNAGLDPSRLTEIYTTFCEHLSLSEQHIKELRSKRGFTDDTIEACRFKSGDVRDVNTALKALVEQGVSAEEFSASGLTVDGKPNTQLTGRRILIPYVDRDGRVYRIRPHKLGFKGMGVDWYCGLLAAAHRPEPLVITEGEFKAAALYQLGYATIAVPGISSFGAKHFDRLENAVAALKPKSVVVCFDHEVKDDPRFDSFKEKYTDRYDTEYWSWMMAWKLSRFGAKVARLPAEWMEKGKIDCDGALAQGRTRADFDLAFRGALAPEKFLAALNADASAVVRRKVQRHLKAHGARNLIARRSVTEGYGYTWIKPPRKEGEDPEYIPISNFLIKLEQMVHSDTENERRVRLVNSLGEESDVLTLTPADMTPNTAFERWCHAQGPYTWKGKPAHLRGLWEHLDAQEEGAQIRRTVTVGEVEPRVFLFENALIAQGKLILPSPKDGICWNGRKGFQLDSDDDHQPRLYRTKPVDELNTAHAGLLNLLRDNYKGSYLPWLGLGWGIATLFSRELFNTSGWFPLLFCCGEKGSGKTTFCRWMMNGFFGIDTQGKPLLSTEKSSFRLLAKRSSLPAWYDEFRDSRAFERHIASFCNVYNRQGYARAKRSGDHKTDTVPVNGTLMLAGISPPKDESLQARCIYLPFSLHGRDRELFKEVNKSIQNLNDILMYVLLNYDRLLPMVIHRVQEATDVFFEATGDARLAGNYAVAVAAFTTICEDIVDTDPMISYCAEMMNQTGEQLEEEHPLNELWLSISNIAGDHKYINKEHMYYDGSKVYVWFSGMYHVFERDYTLRKRGEPPLRESVLRKMLQEQSYYIEESRKRLKGTLRRCVVLDFASAPEGVRSSIGAIYGDEHYR
jgi:DNA primase